MTQQTNQQKRSLAFQLHQRKLEQQERCSHTGRIRFDCDGHRTCKDCGKVMVKKELGT